VAVDREPRPVGPLRLPGRRIAARFFARNTLAVAEEILGALLCRRERDGTYSYGRIVETEAYVGEEDPACHARSGRTPRTRVLYGRPGRAYVYFTYGMHHLVNFVTEREGFPAAVLVRALRPEAGVRRMARRRGTRELGALTSGPSRLCQALAIDLRLNDVPLSGPDLVVCADGGGGGEVGRGPRIGIRAGADRLWRFYRKGDPYVSPGRRAGAPGARSRSPSG